MKLSYESISEDCSVVLNTNTLMALLPIFPASASFIINHYKSHLEREYPFDIISGLYPPTRTKVSQVLFIVLIYFKILTYCIHLDAWDRCFEICCLLTKAVSANSDPGWYFMIFWNGKAGWTWTIPSDWWLIIQYQRENDCWIEPFLN